MTVCDALRANNTPGKNMNCSLLFPTMDMIGEIELFRLGKATSLGEDVKPWVYSSILLSFGPFV